jgi:hypothetical protein
VGRALGAQYGALSIEGEHGQPSLTTCYFRDGETDEAARDGNCPERARRLRHLSLTQAPVDSGEGPVALADDHDAVGSGHAAETRDGLGEIAMLELPEDVFHPAMIVMTKAARQVPGGLYRHQSGPRVTSTRARRSRAARAPESRSE